MSSPTTETIDVSLKILNNYFNIQTVGRCLLFIGAEILTILVAWFVPWLLRKLFRDYLGWELNFTSEMYKDLFIKQYKKELMARTRATQNQFSPQAIRQLKEETDIYVDNELKSHFHGCRGFIRTNLFSIFYFVIRVGLFVLGSTLSLIIVNMDFILILTSLGVGGFITVLQMNEYLRQLFAHFFNVFTSKVKMGEIAVLEGGVSGYLVDFGVVHSTFIGINPHYDWSQEEGGEQKSPPHTTQYPDDGNSNSYMDGESLNQKTMDILHSTNTNPITQYQFLSNLRGVGTGGGGGGGLFSPHTPARPTNFHRRTFGDMVAIHLGNQRSKTSHPVYQQKLVEWHIPNYELVFGRLYIIHF